MHATALLQPTPHKKRTKTFQMHANRHRNWLGTGLEVTSSYLPFPGSSCCKSPVSPLTPAVQASCGCVFSSSCRQLKRVTSSRNSPSSHPC
jgi:hypothetical protein